MYSNPPAHGAKIVVDILRGSLRKEWERDLEGARGRIVSMREELIARLEKRIDVSYICGGGRGCLCMSI